MPDAVPDEAENVKQAKTIVTHQRLEVNDRLQDRRLYRASRRGGINRALERCVILGRFASCSLSSRSGRALLHFFVPSRTARVACKKRARMPIAARTVFAFSRGLAPTSLSKFIVASEPWG